MRKLTKRIVGGSLFAVILTLASLLALMLYPSNIFATRVAYRNFTLYSNEPLNGPYTDILDHALALAAMSELYAPEHLYDVYLTEGTLYKDISTAMFGRAMARSQDNNILLNLHVDFDRDRLSSSTNWRNLTQTIAHEMIHCLQVRRYGMWSINPIHHPPLWKMEGYPEYIALQETIHAPGYDFRATVKKLMTYIDHHTEWPEVEPGRSENIVYLKGRVMIEYLMDIRGMTYDQILRDSRSEEDIYRELITWYKHALA